MQKKYLYFMAASHLCNDINSGALPALLPFLVMYYGIDYASVGGIMFAGSFLSSVVQPLFGYLADRSDRGWFMGLGVMVSGVSLGLTGFLTDYWAIFAAVTAMGIGSSVFHPEAARLVNVISSKNRGTSMSIFSVGGNGGFGIGPLLMVALVSAFGMKGTAFFGVVAIIMGGALFYFVPRIKTEVRRMSAAVERQAAEGETGSKPVLRNDWSGFSRLTLVLISRSIVFSGISSFLPLFCIRILGASNAVGSATLSVLSLAGILTTLVGGYLSDRWGYVKTLQRGCIFLVPLLALVVWGGNIWLIYALLLPMSLAMQGPYSSFVVLGQSYLARSVGFASGVTLGLSFSAGGILVPSLGYFGDCYGLVAVMVLLVGVAALCALCTLLLPEPRQA